MVLAYAIVGNFRVLIFCFGIFFGHVKVIYIVFDVEKCFRRWIL